MNTVGKVFFQAENGMHLDAYGENQKSFLMNGIAAKNLEHWLQVNFWMVMTATMILTWGLLRLQWKIMRRALTQ